jgi:Cu/Ag efflux protein CusF
MTNLRTTAAAAALFALFASFASQGVAQQAGGPGAAQESPSKSAMGRIVSIDATGGTITLEDGKTFALPDAEYLKSVKLGDRVTVEYKTDDKGVLVATAVKTSA